MSSFLRGSKNAVLDGLFRFFRDDLYRYDDAHLAKVRAAVLDVKEGAWLVNLDGHVFEVVEPLMSVEQDVYGCRKGRDCTNVPRRFRPNLEAMIAARLAAGQGTDHRRFDWFRRIDRRFFDPREIRSFVHETLGSPLVAEAAVILADNAARYSPFPDVDVHVTLLPGRMRVRVDSDGSRLSARHKPELHPPGPNGIRPGGLAIIDRQALSWGVVGEQSWSVWADFVRTPGDSTRLATNYRILPASKIPPGSYVYREDGHMAWVPVGTVETSGGVVHLDSLDGYRMPSFPAEELVPVFADDSITA